MNRSWMIYGLYLGALLTSSRADVISGTVTDSSTNAPINQVSVTVNTVTPISTTTDSSGYFTISTFALSLLGNGMLHHDIMWQPEAGTFSWNGIFRDASGRANAVASNQSKSINSDNAVPQFSLRKSAAENVVTFSKANYATVTKSVSGSESNLQVKMQPQAGGTISFNPPAEVYPTEQNVTITSNVSGATIRYTVDGSVPTSTTGMVYSGPVTMQKCINTDRSSAMVTNASGVTMLKAAPFKNGVQSGAVFTGIYTILDPVRYPLTTSPVLGLAHMAYNVSSQNWSSILKLWTAYFGYETVQASNSFALIKINDQQFIELYMKPVVAPQYQLANFGFYVKDAEAYRQQLGKAGIPVPAKCTVNGLGNLSFTTVDPDGHANEWVQYMPGSVTSQSLGQHMPSTELFGYLECYGDATGDVAAADAYYSKVGLAGSGKKVYLPNHNDYLEMLTYTSLTQQITGVHEKAQFITFRGVDVLAAADKMALRDPSIVQKRSTEGGSGFPLHNCVDVYNADLSRVRVIDLNY